LFDYGQQNKQGCEQSRTVVELRFFAFSALTLLPFGQSRNKPSRFGTSHSHLTVLKLATLALSISPTPRAITG